MFNIFTLPGPHIELQKFQISNTLKSELFDMDIIIGTAGLNRLNGCVQKRERKNTKEKYRNPCKSD